MLKFTPWEVDTLGTRSTDEETERLSGLRTIKHTTTVRSKIGTQLFLIPKAKRSLFFPLLRTPWETTDPSPFGSLVLGYAGNASLDHAEKRGQKVGEDRALTLRPDPTTSGTPRAVLRVQI